MIFSASLLCLPASSPAMMASLASSLAARRRSFWCCWRWRWWRSGAAVGLQGRVLRSGALARCGGSRGRVARRVLPVVAAAAALLRGCGSASRHCSGGCCLAGATASLCNNFPRLFLVFVGVGACAGGELVGFLLFQMALGRGRRLHLRGIRYSRLLPPSSVRAPVPASGL